jgi:hypothetical protein
MVKKIEILDRDSKVKGYPYQLTDWFLLLKDLDSFLEPFRKYKEEKDAIIAYSPSGYCIFTTGKRLSFNETRSNNR